MSDDPTERTWTHLVVERRGAIVEVALNRPDGRNALNPLIMQELTEVARLLHRRSDVHAVILRATGPNFSAGADLDAVQRKRATPTLLELREIVMAGPDMCRAWEDIEAVTIAAVEGYCLGGACALVIACDFRILGDGASMRLPEVPLGINMSWNSVPRLTRMLGAPRAKRFVLFGEAADAQACVSWGMADEVTPTGEALQVARTWAEKVSRLPQLPVRMTKEAINAQTTAGAYLASFMDRDQYILTSRTEDFAEGLRGFFERRPPVFRGD